MTPRPIHVPCRVATSPVSLRGGTTKQSQASGGTQTRLLHYRSQRHPKGQRHRPHPVSLRGGTTKQSQPAAAPKPDCFTTVRNDTPSATPPHPNRVIATRQRRSNPDRRAPLAMTPRPVHVSLRGGTTKQSQPAAAPTPDCVTPFATTPKGQHHRPQPVSLRGGNDEAIQIAALRSR